MNFSLIYQKNEPNQFLEKKRKEKEDGTRLSRSTFDLGISVKSMPCASGIEKNGKSDNWKTGKFESFRRLLARNGTLCGPRFQATKFIDQTSQRFDCRRDMIFL